MVHATADIDLLGGLAFPLFDLFMFAVLFLRRTFSDIEAQLIND